MVVAALAAVAMAAVAMAGGELVLFVDNGRPGRSRSRPSVVFWEV